MKKCIILMVLMAFLLTGCGAWLDGEYHSVKAHESSGSKISEDVVTVGGYNELKEALVKMVTSGQQSTTFYLTGVDAEVVDQYMNTAIMHIFQNSAIGAYAVDTIAYEEGSGVGAITIAVDVNYIHGRQEILRIKNTTNMDGVESIVAAALKNCDPSTVIKVKEYEKMDVTQFVQDYVDSNPHICMEMPQVAYMVYPDRGQERVLEISFTYQTSREALRVMQENVAPIISAAKLYVQGSEGKRQKYEQLYAFLMERFEYHEETSITPAYSLLRYGVGDSKAFALVYSIMCRNAGLECDVISGTRDGEAYYWNHVKFDDHFYHVDLLASSKTGEFTPMLSEEMSGYVWDYFLFE